MQTLRLTIDGYFIRIVRPPKTSLAVVKLNDTQVRFNVRGDKVTHLEGDLPEAIRESVIATIERHFRTKV